MHPNGMWKQEKRRLKERSEVIAKERWESKEQTAVEILNGNSMKRRRPSRDRARATQGATQDRFRGSARNISDPEQLNTVITEQVLEPKSEGIRSMVSSRIREHKIVGQRHAHQVRGVNPA